MCVKRKDGLVSEILLEKRKKVDVNYSAIIRKNRMIFLKRRRDIRGREMSLYESKRIADDMNKEINNKNVCAGGPEYWWIGR